MSYEGLCLRLIRYIKPELKRVTSAKRVLTEEEREMAHELGIQVESDGTVAGAFLDMIEKKLHRKKMYAKRFKREFDPTVDVVK